MVNIDTRVISSRILDPSENGIQMRSIFRNFPKIEENIKFLDSRVDVCKGYWKNFHM